MKMLLKIKRKRRTKY